MPTPQGRGRNTALCLLLTLCVVALPVAGMKNPNSFTPSANQFDLDELMSGPLDDATCNIEAVNTANNVQLACILSDLMDTTFFRLFTVDLEKECPFFGKAEPEAPSTCGGDEPDPIDKPVHGACSLEKDGSSALFPNMRMWKSTDHVDQSLSTKENLALQDGLAGEDVTAPTFWLDMCDSIVISENATTVNLRKNPERWTGYNGSLIWQAIYEENCFRISAGEASKMCYEERVLYKLLSAMHTSINVHIALDYYPPLKGKRKSWESNPAHFVERYSDHPDRIKNLHFAFVVLLRAVRKAGPILLKMDYQTDANANETGEGTGKHTLALMERLLQTDLLKSCNEVFGAFDETLLFQSTRDGTKVSELKRNFKQVFRNVSRILDCVSCQKCKLHGKLSLLGLGTALKTLLLPPQMLEEGLRSGEIVALINTLGKFSKAIQGARDLTIRYRNKMESFLKDQSVSESKGRSVNPPRREAKAKQPSETTLNAVWPWGTAELILALDQALSLVQGAATTPANERRLVDAILSYDPRVLLLGKHFAHDPALFVDHALRVLSQFPAPMTGDWGAISGVRLRENEYDLVVIGGGLTGMTAALSVLDQGGKVCLIEKEPFLGGNSAWASSGVNAADPASGADSVEKFAEDTLRSGKGDTDLVYALVNNSADSIRWIEERLSVSLDQVAQLGGHSVPRTRRSTGGMIGQELVTRIAKKIKEYKDGTLRLLLRTSAEKVSHIDGSASPMKLKIEYATISKDGQTTHSEVRGRFVAITTGGYANDRDPNGLIGAHRPDLEGLPTTNGRWATGDGVRLAVQMGADTVDLDQVQVHPTAFLDLKEPDAPRKTLAAELLRGVGGILLTREQGKRFVDELAPRDDVVAAMRAAGKNSEKEGFILLLSDTMAKAAGKHAEHYLKKGLLKSFSSLAEFAEWSGLSRAVLESSLVEYNRIAEESSGSNSLVDPFGKKYFKNTPIDYLHGGFVAGIVVPAIHYTMGGLRTDATSSVLDKSGNLIPGLLAGGEVAGGMHGKNRLGGNAMTECIVFGRIIAKKALRDMNMSSTTITSNEMPSRASQPTLNSANLPTVAREELSKHNTASDCWVALYGKIYNMTDFLSEHPAGPEAILKSAGQDGTEEFAAIHVLEMLEDFEPIGVLS